MFHSCDHEQMGSFYVHKSERAHMYVCFLTYVNQMCSTFSGVHNLYVHILMYARIWVIQSRQSDLCFVGFKSVNGLILSTFFNNKIFCNTVASTCAIADFIFLGTFLRVTFLPLCLGRLNEMTFFLWIFLFSGRREPLLWVPLCDGTILTLGTWGILISLATISTDRLFCRGKLLGSSSARFDPLVGRVITCLVGFLHSTLQGVDLLLGTLVAIVGWGSNAGVVGLLLGTFVSGLNYIGDPNRGSV